ncbi:MAG: hypothetical protein IJ583_00530, partial [Firmicutes bacterium]|nr:hypothetical protein [Bacillota bacterium]
MISFKKIFAILFAVMAVMLMSTAVFADESLWINESTDITKTNDDILNNGGVLKYNSKTKTLTINGDAEAPYHSYLGYYGTLVSSDVDGLTVNVEGDSHIKGGLAFSKDTKITGSGKLYLENTQDAINVLNNSTLTFENADVTIINCISGLQCYENLNLNGGNLNLINSNLDITTSE